MAFYISFDFVGSAPRQYGGPGSGPPGSGPPGAGPPGSGPPGPRMSGPPGGPPSRPPGPGWSIFVCHALYKTYFISLSQIFM